MALIPPPPTYMNPGSPVFIEWLRQISAFASEIGEYGTFGASLAIMYGAPQCCMQAFLQKIATVTIKERKDGFAIVTGYINTVLDSGKVCIYSAIIELRRNGVVIERVDCTLGDNYSEGIVKYVDTAAEEEAEYTMWAGGIPGSSAPCSGLEGAGLLVEIR